MESSQGCYGCCSFCAVHAQHDRAWHAKTAENVLAEADMVGARLPECTERAICASFEGFG